MLEKLLYIIYLLGGIEVPKTRVKLLYALYYYIYENDLELSNLNSILNTENIDNLKHYCNIKRNENEMYYTINLLGLGLITKIIDNNDEELTKILKVVQNFRQFKDIELAITVSSILSHITMLTSSIDDDIRKYIDYFQIKNDTKHIFNNCKMIIDLSIKLISSQK